MEPTPAPRSVPICRQILTSGHYCKCPAMRSGVFCYYHNRQRQRRRIFEKAQEIQRHYDQKRDARTEEEFNHEVVFSLQLPELDDRASIHVACSNIIRALYCDHISIAKARVMMRAIAEANLSLRRGSVLDDYKQPILESDPEPLAPLGDSDGCVLPEERGKKQAIVEGRRLEAERADREIAAARARGESPAPRPLTPEEQQALALDDLRDRAEPGMLEFYDQVIADPATTADQRQQIAADRDALVERRRARAAKSRATPVVSLREAASEGVRPGMGNGLPDKARLQPRIGETQGPFAPATRRSG